MTELSDILSQFVLDMCSGRDESHGHYHMQQVTKTSLYIFDNEIEKYTNNKQKQEYIKKLVICVAWLHDVADHKYDKNGFILKQVNNFLHNLIPEDANMIEKIIDRISYSKENNAKIKNIPLDWKNELGEDGCFVRDVVSDADKLEALGTIGLHRCIEYTKEKYLQDTKSEIEFVDLVKRVKNHADEKLLRLKDEFIRTQTGKKLAEKLHNEFVDQLQYFCLNIV